MYFPEEVQIIRIYNIIMCTQIDFVACIKNQHLFLQI